MTFWSNKIAYYHKNMYICNMNQKKISEYLSSAEGGNSTAQHKLCQIFYDNDDICQAMPDDFWKRTDKQAQDGYDYANFIMHCRYFDNPATSNLSYDYIRKAIRHKDIPLAILRLGISYAKGIGIKENHVLANYFFDMASTMGCKEADSFIDQEYESGRRNIVHEIENAIKNFNFSKPNIKEELIRRIERERVKKNYGYLSDLREYITIIYPEYNPQKGIEDILNNRDTLEADLCYSLSSSRNRLDVCVELLDSLLCQLYAPIIQNKALFQSIIEHDDAALLEDSERELLQCIVNITSSYDKICEKYNIEKKEMLHMDSMELYPYFKVSMITTLKRQALCCLYSIKDIDPLINDKFISYMDSDEQMLNMCEEIEDENLQFFLISFVELNIDIESIMLNYHSLLRLFRDHQLDGLAKHLNDFVKRLNDIGLEHQLPEFTSENLPTIELV